MLHAVIMAGGSGLRFWPKSRRNRPKQLLKLFGDRSMLQATVDRIAPMVPRERVWIITGADQAEAVREQLPELPAANVIGEPCSRDTGPCVGLAATLITRQDPDATMIVMPADHLIEPAAVFRKTVDLALAEIERDPTSFVIFGVKPTRPETGYGYIEQAEQLAVHQGIGLFRVSHFKEKPDRATAERYVAAGNYSWNAGIFVWRARAVLDALRRFRPVIAEHLDRIAANLGTAGEAAAITREFSEMERVPIDRAVMEQYPNVRVLEVVYDWSDVGDWRSLAAALPRDRNNNAIQGQVQAVDTKNTLILADDGHPIVALGVEDLVIVQSGGATLIARKAELDKLKGVVEGLDAAGWGSLL